MDEARVAALNQSADRDPSAHGVPGRPHAATERGGQRVRLLADSLAREFSAPVGVLDPRKLAWRVVVGAAEEHFPPGDEQLEEVVCSSTLRLGRVALWRRKDDPSLTWLVMPFPISECADLLAFAGFRSDLESQNPHQRVRLGDAPAGPRVTWGPICPAPALRAWGQQLLNRLHGDYETRLSPVVSAPSSEEESEHVVIGRLIRRMRISDAPARFQALATNVLRTSLDMAAVAWVSSEVHEPVVVSGEIPGLASSAYRDFISRDSRDSAYLVNETDRGGGNDHADLVRRFVSVPAGSAGWLIAVNPLHDRPIGTTDVERMQYVASLIAAQSSNARVYAELKELLFGIIRALTAAIDAKDPYTCGHSERVARIAIRLAEELKMPAQKRSDLYLAGLLHDVGKIGVDDLVLKKTGPLTPEEYRVIQAHVEIGVTILKDLKKLHHIIPGVRHHHESLDGSGYPDHLSGDDIPLEARILAVADSFDAMSSNRPYRKRLTPMQIDDIFKKGRGSQWDPKVVDALFACRMDLEAIRQKGLGESLIGAVNLTLGRS
jgi:putative nucleotidyltransferase with HDIG domain